MIPSPATLPSAVRQGASSSGLHPGPCGVVFEDFPCRRRSAVPQIPGDALVAGAQEVPSLAVPGRRAVGAALGHVSIRAHPKPLLWSSCCRTGCDAVPIMTEAAGQLPPSLAPLQTCSPPKHLEQMLRNTSAAGGTQVSCSVFAYDGFLLYT